jgi:hypothetical protein
MELESDVACSFLGDEVVGEAQVEEREERGTPSCNCTGADLQGMPGMPRHTLQSQHVYVYIHAYL